MFELGSLLYLEGEHAYHLTTTTAQNETIFLKRAYPGHPLFFRPFLISISITQIEMSIDGLLGIWTRGPLDGEHRRYHGAMAAANRNNSLQVGISHFKFLDDFSSISFGSQVSDTQKSLFTFKMLQGLSSKFKILKCLNQSLSVHNFSNSRIKKLL